MLRKIYLRVRNAILDLKISFKLIVFIIFISVLTMSFMSKVFDYKMEQVIENELSQSYEQIVNQYASNINYKLDIYQTLLTNIASNSTIGEQLGVRGEKSKNEAYSIGMKISKEVGMLLGARNIRELYNMMLYSYDMGNPIYGPKVSSAKSIEDEDWYINMKKNGKVNDYFFYTIRGTKNEIISFTKQIANINGARYGEKLGFVKLDIYARSFFGSILNFENKHNANIFILDEKGNVLYGEGNKTPSFGSENMNELLHNISGKKFTRLSGEKVVLVHRGISNYGWKVVFAFHYGEIEKKANDVRRAIITFIIITSIIILGVTILFSRKFSSRINILLNKMDKVENGDMEITEVIEGNDEIGIVDRHFNKMVGKIQHLINNNYIQQLEKREAELNALQFQINPHFLYNTLETINSIASVNRCFEICEISQKLGEMFRYSINISRSDFVALGKELKHIENYIYIQKIRFKERFEVFYNIEGEAARCRILKFILQPIVENAIVHGFKDKEGAGCIEIAAYIHDNKLIIKVEDDGNGMEEEKVEMLNNYINKKDENVLKAYTKSIGIRNVNMRIKLACGDDYGINISSEPNIGTRVIFTLPAYGLGGEDLHV